MSAAVRAIATRVERPLINDPFAAPLVQAVGVDVLTRLVAGEGTNDLVAQATIDVAVVRTRFYDGFFLDSASAGITQFVILASGLDSRAYRLPSPAGTVVYELDQPRVLEFKTRTLAELALRPEVHSTSASGTPHSSQVRHPRS